MRTAQRPNAPEMASKAVRLHCHSGQWRLEFDLHPVLQHVRLPNDTIPLQTCKTRRKQIHLDLHARLIWLCPLCRCSRPCITVHHGRACKPITILPNMQSLNANAHAYAVCALLPQKPLCSTVCNHSAPSNLLRANHACVVRHPHCSSVALQRCLMPAGADRCPTGTPCMRAPARACREGHVRRHH